MKPFIGEHTAFIIMVSCSYEMFDTCLPNCSTVTGKP